MKTLAIVPMVLLALAAPALAQPNGGGAPPAPEQPPAVTPPEGAAPDLAALRQEYFRLRDSLFRSRARAAAVASAMYSSRLQIRLFHASGRFQAVSRASIRLDGASVYEDTEGAITEADASRFEGWIAPGRHQITIRIESAGKDDQRFASSVEESFVVQAIAGHDLIIRAVARDDGDIAYAWQRKQRGSYKLHLDVDVQAVKRKAGNAGK
jgi:hypothetical protein